MFVSLCILESIDADGTTETLLINIPRLHDEGGGEMPVDLLRHTRGQPLPGEVDVGPLRVYAADAGVRLQRIQSRLGGTCFQQDGDRLHIHLTHSALPVRNETTAYYSALLPRGFYGQVRARHELTELWLTDQNRALVGGNLWNYGRGNCPWGVELHADLRKVSAPPDRVERVESAAAYADTRCFSYDGRARQFLSLLQQGTCPESGKVFLCYSSADRSSARALFTSLSHQGTRAWFDEVEIGLGDSLFQELQDGVGSADALVVLLSPRSVASRWCREELHAAMHRQVTHSKTVVLPVLLENCDIPTFLLEKKYADLRDPTRIDDVAHEITSALQSLRRTRRDAPLASSVGPRADPVFPRHDEPKAGAAPGSSPPEVSQPQPLTLPYQVPELRRNGDFYVALEQLKRTTVREPRDHGDAVALEDQLERLLFIAGIGTDRAGDESMSAAAANPVIAMRAATAATKLAVTLAGHDPQQEQSLNLLRVNLLLGVTGIRATLAEEDLTRCMHDCRDLVLCLVGALSDVASTAPETKRGEAMERYHRVCDVVFR